MAVATPLLLQYNAVQPAGISLPGSRLQLACQLLQGIRHGCERCFAALSEEEKALACTDSSGVDERWAGFLYVNKDQRCWSALAHLLNAPIRRIDGFLKEFIEDSSVRERCLNVIESQALIYKGVLHCLTGKGAGLWAEKFLEMEKRELERNPSFHFHALHELSMFIAYHWPSCETAFLPRLKELERATVMPLDSLIQILKQESGRAAGLA